MERSNDRTVDANARRKASTIVLVGHGSRAPEANALVERIGARLAEARPDANVHVAYVELAEPHVEQVLMALAATSARILVLPLFLFGAGHVKTDLPLIAARVREQFPNVAITFANPLGVHPALARAIAARVGREETPSRIVVLVGRGSSDPDANADAAKLARLVAEELALPWVLLAFAAVAKPRVPEVIEAAARLRPAEIVVVPYLLSAGRVVDAIAADVAKLEKSMPWIRFRVTAPLGDDAEVLEVLEERLDAALDDDSSLACDSCQYRTPIGPYASRVGGMRALLYSIRHLDTHKQTGPHVHAHKPLAKHVFVCANADCATRGSVRLVAALRKEVAARGLTRSHRITRTSCMGRCGEGPTVVVYPDGVFYRSVSPDDARELVTEHLVGDRLVARLVDTILS